MLADDISYYCHASPTNYIVRQCHIHICIRIFLLIKLKGKPEMTSFSYNDD